MWINDEGVDRVMRNDGEKKMSKKMESVEVGRNEEGRRSTVSRLIL